MVSAPDDKPKPTNLQRLVEKLPDMVASVSTGLVDMAVTGTPSAGALAPFVELGLEVGTEAWKNRGNRGARALAAAADRTGGLERLAELATADDSSLELTIRTMEAAMRTTREAKIVALGRVLGSGLEDEVSVDEAQILLTALDVVEAPHLRVLVVLRDHADANAPEVTPANRAELLTLSRDQLSDKLPGHAAILGAVVQVLEGQHLIQPVGMGLTYESWGGPGRWAITDLGRACLQRVEDAQ